MNSYLQEVVDLHQLIEARFARGEGSLEAMMEHFVPSFSMVHPRGCNSVCRMWSSFLSGTRAVSRG